jgi:tRNA A-37 threonylcarbamoyl transferase component Bud32
MTDDRWLRVQQLFDEALARPEAEREPYLQSVCGNDPDLLHEVTTLLAHDRAVDPAFLEAPQPLASAPPRGAGGSTDPLVGTNVGGYEVKAVIGRGGMSTVYEAVQQNPRRVVALKVMKAGIASRSALRRFQFEAQLLARLLHPNIAQVYEAGTHDGGLDGVPYFAMEHVPGARSIIDYADHRMLGARERVELFAQVCDAVHHGHQRCIIHRDLKPANILVNETGQVKIIDFGVARATDADVAAATVVGELVGTLQYMSPEQCDADPHDLDLRTDVYSLGVVLYELLIGRLPYDSGGSSIYKATRVIKETAPARPSSVNRRLRGDIETIILKALEKDRDRRYQSAADLARDIRHYLNREPIEARPPNAWNASIRWVARHPVTVTAGACLTVGLLSLLGTWLGYAASVRSFYGEPHELAVDESRDVARLLSRGGMELATWEVPSPGAINEAALVKVPAEFGGGQLALLAYGAQRTHKHAGQVCAYLVSNGEYEDPTWTAQIEQEDLPRALAERGHAASLAGANKLFLAEIFGDVPGKEVVAVHDFGSSGIRAIRILDLEGKVLYQVWHNGHFSACHWMTGARLLVLAGDNCDALWQERGQPNAKNLRPWVVFALKPTLDFRSNQFLRTSGGESNLHPEWYRCLHYPFSELWIGDLRLTRPSLSKSGDLEVQLDFYLDENQHAGVGWAIDEHGEMVPGTRSGNDYYDRDASDVPLEEFFLGDLPPILSRKDDASGQKGSQDEAPQNR